MQVQDLDAVVAVGTEALWTEGPEEGWWRRARVEHVLGTDPRGAWVADDDGDVVGVAMAIVREQMWGLSLLAVAERAQGRGAGRSLVRAALATADGPRGAMILSSEHPAAMRIYAGSGFALRPCVAAAGAVRFRPDASPLVRALDERDTGWMDEVARTVRGGPSSTDLPLWRMRDARFVGVERRGWAAALDGRLLTLMALDDETAALVLRAHLRTTHEATIGFISAGHDWAVAECLAAGLVLSPDGPLFVRGRPGTLAPYLPNGAFF